MNDALHATSPAGGGLCSTAGDRARFFRNVAPRSSQFGTDQPRRAVVRGPASSTGVGAGAGVANWTSARRACWVGDYHC